MQRYKMARWKLILRRGPFHRSLIRSARDLRHSRSPVTRIVATVMLTIAWLVLPLLPGCGRRTPTSQPTSDFDTTKATQPHTPLPKSPSPTAAGRSITIRGLDNDYRGTTRVLPNKQLIHQKGSHD